MGRFRSSLGWNGIWVGFVGRFSLVYLIWSGMVLNYWIVMFVVDEPFAPLRSHANWYSLATNIMTDWRAMLTCFLSTTE